MVPFRAFTQAVANVVLCLDAIEQFSLAAVLRSMNMAQEDGVGILIKMQDSGLIAMDNTVNGQIVCITFKGRMLAQDIRAMTDRVVGK
jgi:predicted transcriptional regulator